MIKFELDGMIHYMILKYFAMQKYFAILKILDVKTKMLIRNAEALGCERLMWIAFVMQFVNMKYLQIVKQNQADIL